MTAAHCVVNYDYYQLGWRCRTMSSQSVPMSKVEPELIMAHVGTTCPPGSCYPRGTEYKASAVFVHPDFNICAPTNDIAIIELTTDISKTDGVPICMPESNATIVDTLESTGFGFNPFFYSNPWHAGLSLVELIKSRELGGKIETTTKEKSLCRGDSGGPLFQSNDEGRATVVGIASTVEPYCVEVASVRRNFFIDVRPNLAWICRLTGVCPDGLSSKATSFPPSEVGKLNIPREGSYEYVEDGSNGVPEPRPL
ncbi:trypsin [Ancylostoma duodenale]|uniref:Trypsin n=1 Tax=Ancylostoma duodenale TaxID=51022 RepID=A0A0C2GTX3_9BILA|nr:trypsin [Ancylostoma duodenale]